MQEGLLNNVRELEAGRNRAAPRPLGRDLGVGQDQVEADLSVIHAFAGDQPAILITDVAVIMP